MGDKTRKRPAGTSQFDIIIQVHVVRGIWSIRYRLTSLAANFRAKKSVGQPQVRACALKSQLKLILSSPIHVETIQLRGNYLKFRRQEARAEKATSPIGAHTLNPHKHRDNRFSRERADLLPRTRGIAALFARGYSAICITQFTCVCAPSGAIKSSARICFLAAVSLGRINQGFFAGAHMADIRTARVSGVGSTIAKGRAVPLRVGGRTRLKLHATLSDPRR